MQVRWFAFAAVLVALAGCGPANEPRTKAGLWVVTAALNGRPRPPAPFCDPGHGVFPRQDADCGQWRLTQTPGGALVLDAICTKLGGVMRLHRRIIGDFATAYTDDMKVVGMAPGQPPSTVWVHFDYRYQGPCPPGMKVEAQAPQATNRASP